MSNLTTIHLLGSLGKRFGAKWQLEVKSPAEAIRAININTKGELERYLRGPAKNKPYKIALKQKENVIDVTELTHRSGDSDIYIIPTIRGNSAVARIIVGVILIVVGVFTSMVGGGVLIGAGASLILGGITQLLTPVPKFQPFSAQQQGKQSTVFAGNAVSVSQGGSIPVVYGRALVPAVPVSITINNNDVSTPPVGTIGRPGYWGLNGGGQQYDPGIPDPVYGPWQPNSQGG